MEDTLGIGALLGMFLPFIISFLKQRHWPVLLKMALTLAVCLVAGTATSAIQGDVQLSGDVVEQPDQLPMAAAAAFTSATVVYKTFVRGSKVDEHLTGP